MTDRTAFRLLPLLLAAAGITSAATPAMKPYSADYDASYMGMHGTGHMSLSQQGNGRWVYSLRIGSSLAQLSQSTVFDVAGDALRPLSGTDSSTLLVKRVTKQASYDWKAGQASWSGDVKPDRAGPIALQAGDVDAMLLNLALPRDVAAGRPLHYRMVDDGRAKRIVATERGRRVSEMAQASSDAVGRRWAERVGEERYAVFQEVLREIVAARRAAITGPGRTQGSC